MKPGAGPGRRNILLCVLALTAVNLAIAGKLFGVEYTAYNGSIEPAFIAVARVMAKYPGQWGWWPFWLCGVPFENAYLPVLPGLTALVGWAAQLSAARAFHIVTAAFYVLGAPALFWMALELSRKLAASFAAALAYSCVSLSTILVPVIRMDAGGAFSLRRFQALVTYGEAPHTVALALLPVAIACFARALSTSGPKWKILAGVAAAAVVLTNAFGIVMLAAALACLLLAFPWSPRWKAAATVAAIGVVSYCWIAPWLSWGVIRAIRANSALAGGDYRYTTASWIALALLGAGFVLLWLLLRRLDTSPALQFFLLFAYIPTGIVAARYGFEVAIIPQPHRYHLEMDLALVTALVFLGDAVLRRGRRVAAICFAAAMAILIVVSVRYGWTLVRPANPASLSEYRIAQWLDRNRPGERAFLPGSAAFSFNAYTDNPQLQGGQLQFATNPFPAIVEYVVYFDVNAGDRAAQDSIFWLKALGARSVVVTGPKSTEAYKPYVHPHKFDGVLPVAWREGDDTIYDVPVRSRSLAHVIPANAVVQRAPIHGLDTLPAEAYVAALEDPRYPVADFQWHGLSDAEVRADSAAGQVISVQVTYDRGWEAWSQGRRLAIRRDGLGQMIVVPPCPGPCEITLRYTGGWETALQRGMSLFAMLIAGLYAWLAHRSSPRHSPR